VVLAGISVGAYLGGRVADRFPRLPTLGWILFLSGLAVFSISPLINWIGGSVFHTRLMVRTLLVTAIVFFVPSCLLGMVSPLVVKLALSHLKEAGSVVGRIYAFSTAGSILGTFTTGFFLISWLGTRNLLFATGALLLVAAPLFGGFFTQRWRFAFFLAFLLLLWPLYHYTHSPVLDKETFFFKESDYFTIKLKRDSGSPGDPLITLYLDNLSHSRSDPANPLRLDFRYIRGYEEIVRWWTTKRESFRTLFIGGGGYTFPRFIETRYPKAGIEVVEIDPEVTRVSRKHLGLSPTSKIQTFNEDARWFVMNLKGEGKYDLIFEDAFNDLSIPFHLTTREFAIRLKRLLKKDGLLLTNVIDRFEKGSFLPSYIRTLEQVFGRGNVHLVTLGEFRDYTGVTNRIVLTSPQKLEIEDLAKGLDSLGKDERMSYIVPQDLLQQYLRQFSPIILTDDYVPVDNLTAPNFDALYSYER
jgi:predicted membrane-bound spermidine synthase